MESWNNWRKNAAEELKNELHGDLKKEKRESIDSSPIYLATKLIKRIKEELPEEYAKVESSYGMDSSAIESSPEWLTKDISQELPEGLNIALELGTLQTYLQKCIFPGSLVQRSKEDLDRAKEIEDKLNKIIESVIGKRSIYDLLNDIIPDPPVNSVNKLETRPLQVLANKLTDGDYFDNKNFTHVMGMGLMRGAEEVQKPMVDSNIRFDEMDGFWVESGINPFMYGIGPLMIMTPYSKQGREFIKKVNFVLMGQKVNDFKEKFLAGLPIENTDKSNGLYFQVPQTDGDSFKIKWMEAFDIILDLKQGKLFRRKIDNVDKSEIESEIVAYRAEINSLRE